METAAEVFVRCLENEGVRHVFGIPGEETLDLNEALDRSSSIEFVPVRHEQGGAFMADAYGRLTGHAGVCLGTLGPGATNLVTGMADAFLDRAPVVALTGQTDLSEMHKESHQYIDVVRMMKPVTKWNARVHDPDIIPEAVRKAFAVAEREKPGATHLELPADVMELPLAADPVPRRPPALVEPVAAELHRAAELLQAAERPVILAGNGIARQNASPALRRFVQQTGLGVITTFMGKGVIDADDEHALFTAGLRAQDYPRGFMGQSDLVVCVGYDLVEWSPVNWNPNRDRRVICIDTTPAESDAHYVPDVELTGDISHILTHLGNLVSDKPPARVVDAAVQPDDPRRAGVALRRRLPDQAAARAARPARADGPQRPADLGCGRSQAVDLAAVAGPRAEHGADLQRRGGDGLRAAGRRGRARWCCRRTGGWSRSPATAGS